MLQLTICWLGALRIDQVIGIDRKKEHQHQECNKVSLFQKVSLSSTISGNSNPFPSHACNVRNNFVQQKVFFRIAYFTADAQSKLSSWSFNVLGALNFRQADF